jgi:hypothetical protein
MDSIEDELILPHSLCLWAEWCPHSGGSAKRVEALELGKSDYES